MLFGFVTCQPNHPLNNANINWGKRTMENAVKPMRKFYCYNKTMSNQSRQFGLIKSGYTYMSCLVTNWFEGAPYCSNLSC